MSNSPIYDQLAAELGPPLSVIAMAAAAVRRITDAMAALLGIGDVTWPELFTAADRQKAIADCLYRPLRPMELGDEPIYDALVNEMGYPHCSPTEALICHPAGNRAKSYTIAPYLTGSHGRGKTECHAGRMLDWLRYTTPILPSPLQVKLWLP